MNRQKTLKNHLLLKKIELFISKIASALSIIQSKQELIREPMITANKESKRQDKQQNKIKNNKHYLPPKVNVYPFLNKT